MANGERIALRADPNDPEDGDVTEEALEQALAERRARSRGPGKAPLKRQVTLRIDQDALELFKAGGRGWQSRINEAVRKAAGL